MTIAFPEIGFTRLRVVALETGLRPVPPVATRRFVRRVEGTGDGSLAVPACGGAVGAEASFRICRAPGGGGPGRSAPARALARLARFESGEAAA